MTPRERKLVIGLLLVMLLGGGGLLYWQVYLPKLDELNAYIEKLRKDNRDSDERITQVLKQRVVLERARQLSLPPDVDMDRREYEKYLRALLRDSGFSDGYRVIPEQPDVNSSPKVGTKKEAVYTLLPFTAQARGNLRAVVEAMDRFYHTPLLHRIKSLSIQRPITGDTTQQLGELNVTLNFEALVLTGASPRGYLLPNIDRWMVAADGLAAARGAPAGLAFGLWAIGPTGLNVPPALDGKPKLPQPARQYASIAGKNIFYGPAPVVRDDKRDDVNPLRYVHLTLIYSSGERIEAFFYDRYNNLKTRLRTSAGFDSFKIMDAEGESLLRGKVVRIEERDLVFKVDEKLYSIHVGQNLEDALKKPLNTEQMKEMGLTVAADKTGGGQ